MESTNTKEYADYLVSHQKKIQSKIVQLPYRLHLKFLALGKTLDIGCGAGRNLQACPDGSVGIDHNSLLTTACTAAGLIAFAPDEWISNQARMVGYFDSILLSHVAEHMTVDQGAQLLKDHLVYLKAGGRIVVICPQEAGYSRDATHVEFMDFTKIKKMFDMTCAIELDRSYSFPFPRWVGKCFPFNEFVVTGIKK